MKSVSFSTSNSMIIGVMCNLCVEFSTIGCTKYLPGGTPLKIKLPFLSTEVWQDECVS